MDIPSAEMTKYAANAMLATKISFMNDIANLCEIWAPTSTWCARASARPRIGNKFIYPGIGYGGSCFPKDVKALVKTASENGYQMEVLQVGGDGQREPEVVLFNKISKLLQRATSPARPSPCGGSPSSPRPTTCARRPRW
jgi:UDPglucose 6-dehydrogenase